MHCVVGSRAVQIKLTGDMIEKSLSSMVVACKNYSSEVLGTARVGSLVCNDCSDCFLY